MEKGAMFENLRIKIEETAPLTDSECDYIFSHFTTKKYKKHQFILQEGADVDNEYFLIKGLVRSYCILSDGKERILQFAWENCWITEYAAFFLKTKSGLFIDCLEDVELLCLSGENREKLMDEFPVIEKYYRERSRIGIAWCVNRILSLLNYNTKKGYDEFMKEYRVIINRIPKHLIASYLGVSREALSRINSQDKIKK